MKSSFLDDVLFFLILATIWRLHDGYDCGQAGSFTNIRAQQIKYDLGNSTAFYFCTGSGILFGSNKRVCQENGVWEGTIPVCMSPVKNFIRSVNQSSQHPNQRADINSSACLNDFLLNDSCIYLQSSDPDKRVFINFDRPYNIVVVRLVVSSSPDSYQNMIVFAFEKSTGLTESDGVRCVSDHNTQIAGVFRCPRPIRTVSLSIRSSSTLPTFVGVYEVYIFEEGFEKNKCSSPDIPAFGDISQNFTSSPGVTQYRCYEKYILVGSNSSFCLENGTWSAPAPVCHRRDSCEPFQSDFKAHGNWTIERNGHDVWRNTLKCGDGYEVYGGLSFVECFNKSHGWSQSNATCRERPTTTTEAPGSKSATSTSEQQQTWIFSTDTKLNVGTQASSSKSATSSIGPQQTSTSSTDTKLIVVGTVSGVISSILVVSILMAFMFGRKRCIRTARPGNDERRDSSYYHYYNGINYEDMLSESSSSCSTSRHQSERAPAKDPRVPDILELVYENPSLYHPGGSRNGSTVEPEVNESSRHIYSEVGGGEGLIYDELDQIPSSNRGSDSSDVFLENEIYGQEEV